MQRRGKVMFVPLLIAALVMLFQYMGADKVINPETGRAARVALSAEQEEALGLQSYKQVLSQAETISSGPEYEMVLRIAQRLAPTTGEAAKDFEWAVSVVKSDQVNAFCLPGGKIVVYTGIIRVAENEAGLAAVMGHEMAHAVARHGSQRLLRTSLAQTFMMGAAASVSMSEMSYEQRRMALGALGAGASYGIILPFSRDHETEADKMGLLYMARAGYDPNEAVNFWRRMAQEGGPKAPEFASTHPSNETRIRDLQEFLPKALEEFQKSAKAAAR